jgi:hypothetical protein
MAVTLRVKNIDKLTERIALGTARPRIRMQIIVRGPAARYALIWEWGRITCEPGPKTMYSDNPAGETRVMTITAPHGFIHIHKNEYKTIIKEEMRKIKFKTLKPSQWNPAVQAAFDRAAKRCANLISNSAPYDTYRLQTAIVSRLPEDASPLIAEKGKLVW